MSQDVFSNIDPAMSGTELAGVLNDFKDAIMSGLSGNARPDELQPGGYWVDTSNDPETWSFKLWTGTDDVEVFKIDLSTGAAAVGLAVDSFSIRKVSDDSVAAILELVKRRIASSGQVQSGDVVGEIRMVGRTDSAGNPVVAKIIYTAGENETSTAFGGTLSFYSTPNGTNTLIEHMRFVDGIVESLVPHKITAQQLASQSIATTATISQLDASVAVVEMTGSTPTNIQGINSSQGSGQLTIHNRSSAAVTLKHQDPGAAEEDRLSLPNGEDIDIGPEESASVIYSDADSRWKAQYKSIQFKGFTQTILRGSGTFTPPSGVSQVIVSGKPHPSVVEGGGNSSGALDKFGKAYTWGFNSVGQLGVGDTTSRSSPVAVLGGIVFKKLSISGTSIAAGLTPQGNIYTWGDGGIGGLGDGTIVSKSSPVLVVGGIRFKDVTCDGDHGTGISENGNTYSWGRNTWGQLGVGDAVNRSTPTLVVGGYSFVKLGGLAALTADGTAYSWGPNRAGQIGDGTTTFRSSPVAVIGGLKFSTIFARESTTGLGYGYTVALTFDGTAYAWGRNQDGNLGVGDVIDRSSPVAVLGNLKFKKISVGSSIGVTSVVAITDDGTAYSWGNNSKGQLGDGTVVSKSSPVAVVGGLKFVNVWSGGRNSMGVTEDGTLYSWGDGAYGQLGDGTTVSKSSPVAVIGGLNFGSYGSNPVYREVPISGPVDYNISLTGTTFGDVYMGDVGEIIVTYANP